MMKETRKELVERLRSIETHLDDLIALLEARIEERRQAQTRREAS
jgi:hypothetical protein